MFRTIPLSIMSFFHCTHSNRYMSCRFADSLRASCQQQGQQTRAVRLEIMSVFGIGAQGLLYQDNLTFSTWKEQLYYRQI